MSRAQEAIFAERPASKAGAGRPTTPVSIRAWRFALSCGGQCHSRHNPRGRVYWQRNRGKTDQYAVASDPLGVDLVLEITCLMRNLRKIDARTMERGCSRGRLCGPDSPHHRSNDNEIVGRLSPFTLKIRRQSQISICIGAGFRPTWRRCSWRTAEPGSWKCRGRVPTFSN